MSPEQLKDTRTASALGKAPKRGPSETLASVAIVGLGYVGLPLSILAASRGFKVVGFDIDSVKVAQLARREADFLSEEDAQLFRRTPTLSLTSDESELADIDIFIVCVPTPVYDDHLPDLRPLESACAIVGRHLRQGSLVIVESTVSPGVCEEIALPALERSSGIPRSEFDFAHCPERVNPGDAQFDVRAISRVIGALTDVALERAARFYEELLDAPVSRMHSIKEAEAVKMVENAFRDVNIAFVNELAISFDKAGIDLVNVLRGASTKPFGFMTFYPGCGVGGHCIPVDPYYLIRYGRQNGFEHRFLVDARRINSAMPRYTVDLLESALAKRKKRLRGSRIALLGLTYKRDIPDTRESPAHDIEKELRRRGAHAVLFDPYVLRLGEKRLEDALSGADAAIIATDHMQFRNLGPLQFREYGVDIVVDGRNCLDKEAFRGSGILYRGIGRGV